MQNSELLSAKGLCKSYGTVDVLKSVDFEVFHKEIVSVVGASGAGKSTLLHLLGTLDTPDAGEVILNGKSIANLPEKQLAEIRNQKIGFIFQFHNLLPEFTALENVLMPAWIAQNDTRPEKAEYAMSLLETLGVGHRKSHLPSQLSGGEQQRVAVARALINAPSVVLADEPSGNLDTRNARELHELFFKLRDELSLAFVIVTHNEELANMTDRRVVMKDGKIVL